MHFSRPRIPALTLTIPIMKFISQHSRISVMSKSIMTRFEDMDEQFDLLEKKIDDLVSQAKAAEKQQGSSNSPTGALVATSRVISQHEYTSPKVVTPKGHRRAGSFSRRCEV